MKTRRQFIQSSIAAASLGPVLAGATESEFGEWKDLFDGKTLNGWKAIPRLQFRKAKPPHEKESLLEKVWEAYRNDPKLKETMEHTGIWKVEDGAIVGGQYPAGSREGAYLITEEEYGDFELEYEMKPDWQTDTGVLIRQHPVGTLGFQILCDHRPNGGIGGVFTNGLGSYLAAPFYVDGDKGENFAVKNFRQGAPESGFRKGRIYEAASFESFLKVWKVNDWNRFRVRCEGANPVITIWVNDLKTCRVETADPGLEDYDAAIIQQLVGDRGHIGLEVHSNSPKRGWEQWTPGAVSRWRNIRIRERIR